MWQEFHRTGRFDLIQGRYALLLLPAVFALPALALRRLSPRVNPALVLAGAAAAMAALNIVGLGLTVDRWYL